MQRRTQPKWKRLLPPVLWSLAGMGLFILLVSASGRNEALKCAGLEIAIDGYKHGMFISETDIKSLIEEDLSRPVKGCPVGHMDLRKLEAGLQRDNWVSKAQLFIDNRHILHVNISERLPVARIFTQSNQSYYIDSAAVMLPLSSQQVADVPVFTNLPDRPRKLAGADSLFWRQLGKMGSYIIADRFLLMQVGQVNVTAEKELELFPVIGNHIVLMGRPEGYVQKLLRLKKFDEQVLAKVGLSKYSCLDLRYAKQIVATLRNQEELPASRLNLVSDLARQMALPPPQPAPPATVPEKQVPEKEKLAAVQKPAPPRSKDTKAAPAKEVPAKQTARTAPKKAPERTPQKKLAAVPAKTTETSRKIVAASNNKPAKKALEQLPKKTEKPGMIEIDIRRKTEPQSRPAKAVMPQKKTN